VCIPRQISLFLVMLSFRCIFV